MSNIFVYSTGNGSAWVDNPTPVNGDIITLYAYANSPDVLYDINATDQDGHSIALPVTPVQMFSYQGSWGDMTIYVTFTGSPPPPPPIGLPAWLICILSKGRRL